MDGNRKIWKFYANKFIILVNENCTNLYKDGGYIWGLQAMHWNMQQD